MPEGGVPMSDDVKYEMMKRETKLAMEDLVEDISDDITNLRKLIADFKEDSDTALPGYLMITMLVQQLSDKVSSSVRRFRRRVDGL
jgi:hypothetical protein